RFDVAFDEDTSRIRLAHHRLVVLRLTEDCHVKSDRRPGPDPAGLDAEVAELLRQDAGMADAVVANDVVDALRRGRYPRRPGDGVGGSLCHRGTSCPLRRRPSAMSAARAFRASRLN